jgi:hypothetical protein
MRIGIAVTLPKNTDMVLDETQIREEIARLRTTLTGNLFEDGDTQQQIYELKKQLNPAIAEHPELDDDDECLSCGG